MRQETRAATTTISGRAIPSEAPSLLLSHLIHLGTPSGTTTNSEEYFTRITLNMLQIRRMKGTGGLVLPAVPLIRVSKALLLTHSS